MESKKKDEHLVSPIYLDFGNLIIESEKVLSITPKRVTNQITKELDKLERSPNCEICGGLKQEIAFIYHNKRFSFTCYKIEDLKTRKILKQTNYERFARYCEGVLTDKNEKQK